MSFSNFLMDIEHGTALTKEYSGDFKPIEFVYEKSANGHRIENEIGIKVNFNDESGFKISFGSQSMSFESAYKDNYFEFIVEPNRLGFTVSNEVDWKNYSVGEYSSYYVRPLNLTLTFATAAIFVAAVYYTYGAIVPVLVSAFSSL